MENKELLEKRKELYFQQMGVSEKLKPGYELCIEAHKCWTEGRVLDTIELMERALEFFQKHEAYKEMANILDFLGDVYYMRGNIEKALRCYKACLDVCETVEDEFSVAVMVEKIIHVYRTKNEYDKMLPYLYRNLEIGEKYRDAHRAARALVGIGDAYRFQKNFEAAKDAYSLAYKIYKGMGARELAEKVREGLDLLEKEKNNLKRDNED
ncbi:tetratricopeptide repeat protein [Thermodesulfobacterium sp. TA1]|uniref:tetratricopeptide repeat protein n=1 Tax=Thermodesulfobacterium sp. TA1 TaxID=2234087 RepID=UPI00123199D3|nr:tetratricopeptide repeat protein [Thermodesulfobacterium sp. TA1]QER41418.1 tetratricopeptide repeat protein [Thermodesulfobacterium sp. TA1]